MKKKLNMKSFLLWILCAVSIFSCIPIILVFLKYVNIDKQSFCDYLFSMSDGFIGVSFEALQNTYITIFTCFVGIYFAILGIMMANLKVSFVDFFKFSFDIRFIVFTFSIFIQFIEVVFIFPQIPYVVILEILLYLFIIFLLVFIVLSIFKMSVLQNYKKCLNLFVKRSLKGNEKKIRDFYINFVCKCFPDKNIDILDDFFKELKNRKTNVDALSICLKLINSIESDKKIVYRAKMLFLAKRIMDCIVMKKYDKINELGATYFNVYQKLIFSKKEKNYSYLLEIRDTVYFGLLDNRDDKDLQNFYVYVMDGAKNIIMFSLFNCSESIVYQEIKDFIYMKQLLNIYNGFEKICLHHSKILIDILCRIANFVKINGKCVSLLKSYIDQLELVEKIFIYDIDTEQYQEEQVNTGFHKIKDTRNYYIALLLCYYCSRFGKNRLDEVIKKLSYIRYEAKYQDLKYKNILDTFENITQDSFEKIFFIKKDKYDSVDTVRNKLSEHVKEIKTKQQEALILKDVSELLAKEVERQKEDAYNNFKFYSKYDTKKETDYIVKSVKSNFSISKKSLIDNSIISFGLNYCYYIEPLLYQNLTRILLNYKVKSIDSVLEINGLDNKKENILLVPTDCRNYFSAKNIHGIKYLGLNTIQIEDYIFNLEYFYAPAGLIIKKSDFYSVISLKEIKVSDYNKKEWIKNEGDFVMNIDIEFVFAFDKTKEIIMYRLEY